MSEQNDDKSYSELILGSSMETILAATDQAIPRVPESVFVARVLPLLEKPFYRASMAGYAQFVTELTNPLRVVADGDAEKVLFEVPPLIQTTGVTMPVRGAPTTDTTLRELYQEAERGVDVNRMVTSIMQQVTARPNLQKTLLDPLQAILSRYGKTLDITDEVNKFEDLTPAQGASAKPADIADDSSYTGEFE